MTEQNPYRGYVPIKLGGRERRLRYNLNRLAEIQERVGAASITEIAPKLETMGTRELIYVLHRGLLHEDRNLTEEDVGEFLDDHVNLEYLLNTAMRALTGFFTGREADPEELAADADPQNGRSPSRSSGRRSSSTPSSPDSGRPTSGT